MQKVEDLKMHFEEIHNKVIAVKDQENSGKNEMIQKDLEKMMKTIKNRVSIYCFVKTIGGKDQARPNVYQA